MRIPFDTHAFVKKLVATGVPEPQAEVHAEALGELVIERLATRDDIVSLRDDLHALEERLSSRIESLEERLGSRIESLEERSEGFCTKEDFARLREDLHAYATKADLKDLELRLTLRFGAMLAAAVAIMAVLIRVL